MTSFCSTNPANMSCHFWPPGGTYKKQEYIACASPMESLELPGKSNQFENWHFLYLRETTEPIFHLESWWCGEGEGDGDGDGDRD